MRIYELMYILDPTLDEEGTQALIVQVEDFVKKQGIRIEQTDPWGKRRLAYKIGKHWEGYYVLSQLQAEAHAVAEVERKLRVTDGVLRFLTVRMDQEQAQIERRRARMAEKDKLRGDRQRERRLETEEAAEDEFDLEHTAEESGYGDLSGPDSERMPGSGNGDEVESTEEKR